MDFKIDTKDTFSVITPSAGAITVKMTGELSETFDKMRQSGSRNYIVDFQNCETMEAEAIERLISLHETCYSQNESLVFTGIKSNVLAALKQAEADTVINIAYKMVEAIDIISMEILERDLFGEEEA
jgi:anti-anti-sigma regulatory factor